MQSEKGPEIVSIVFDRREIYQALAEGAIERSSLLEAVSDSRATVDRTLSTLRETDLVTQTDTTYRLTAAGQFVADSYQKHLSDVASEQLSVVHERAEQLSLLDEQPAYKPRLVELSTVSRSTIDRAIDELSDVACIEQTNAGWTTTDSGRQLLEQYKQFVDEVNNILAVRELLGSLPPENQIPSAIIAAGHVESHADQFQLIARLTDHLQHADWYRALLPQVEDSRHVRLWYSLVSRHNVQLELFASSATLTGLRDEFPYLCRELGRSESFAAYQCETPAFGLLLLGEDDRQAASTESSSPASDIPSPSSVVLVVYDDSGVAGFIDADSEAVCDWASDYVQRLHTKSRTATEDLQRASVSLDLPLLSSERLPAALRDAGFVRIDETYFARREPTTPTVAWRVGIGLPEIDAGYAVPRYRDDDQSVAEELLQQLQMGDDIALLGSPGSGKSTIVKRVAHQWYESDMGAVLYRESGTGQQLDSPGTLETVLDHLESPTLVVIEDAVRADAREMFDVMRTYRGSDDVHFLVDARESEWRETQLTGDAQLESFKTEHVTVVTTPALDADECRRLLDRVEEITGRTIGVSAEELLSDVRTRAYESAEDEDDELSTPGLLFLLFHRLASYLEPLADSDEATTLTEQVEQLREDLAAIGETALDVGVLANTLNAAGISLDPALLYTPAMTEDGATEEVHAALDRLDGEILFEQSNSEAYRAIHETWSVEFLRRWLETDREARARERFGNCLTQLLSLADNSSHREQLVPMVGETPVLERILVEPTVWTENTIEQLFRLGQQRPKLAPLFDAHGRSVIAFPSTCPDETQREMTVRLGKMLVGGGYLERARQAVSEGLTSVPDESTAACRLLDVRTSVFLWSSNFEQARETAKRQREIAATLDSKQLEATAIAKLAKVAMKEGAYDRAPELATQALAIRRDIGDRQGEASSLNDLADIARMKSEYEQAREYLAHCLGIYREIEDRRGEANTLKRLGQIARHQSNYEQAREHLQQALAVYRNIGYRISEAISLRELGSTAYRTGEYEQACAYCERSLTLYQDIGDLQGEAYSLQTLGLAAFQQGSYEKARTYCEQCLSLHDEIGDRHGKARLLTTLGLIAFRQGEYDQARTYCEQSAEIDDEIGDRHGRSHNLVTLALIACRQGNYETAIEHCERSLAIGREVGDRNTEAEGLLAHGLVAQRRGAYEDAHEYFQQALEIYQEIGDRNGEAKCLDNLGALARDRREYEVAREYHEDSLSIARDIGAADTEAKALIHLGDLTQHHDALEQANEYLDQADTMCESLGNPAIRTKYCLVAGRLALAQAEHETAREYSQQARETASEIDAPYLLGRSHTLAGEIEAVTTSDEDPHEYWQSALDQFEEIGATEKTLTVLRKRYEYCLEQNNDQTATEWLQHARSVIQESPESTAAIHREWITGDETADQGVKAPDSHRS